MIDVENVTRRYGPNLAVDQLNLQIRPGEIFSFLGPNGAGKTTTIKMLVGLLRPNSGTITIGGFDVQTQPDRVHAIVGYVPDQPYLYDKLSGREFLEFITELHGLDAEARSQSIATQIEEFRLQSCIDTYTDQYSHGLKQRLAFAAALVHHPSVLIVDEPMVGLDPRSMREIIDFFRRKADEGVTIFMSTHTLPVAEEISDRIGVFHRGRVQFVGTLEELRRERSHRNGSLESLFLSLTQDNPDSPHHGG